MAAGRGQWEGNRTYDVAMIEALEDLHFAQHALLVPLTFSFGMTFCATPPVTSAAGRNDQAWTYGCKRRPKRPMWSRRAWRRL
jgi:hypothetical protein